MSTRVLVLALAAYALALPTSSNIGINPKYHDLVLRALHTRDDPGSHSNHGSEPVKGDKEGMSHGGAGGAAPMVGGNPMGGASGSLADYMLGSSYTQPLLKMAVGYFPTMPLLKTVDGQSKAKKAGARKTSLWFGPFDVATVAEKKKHPNSSPIAMDPQGTSFITQAAKFPKDINILNAEVKLRYEDGSLAGVGNGIYNHHVVFADAYKAPLALVACPGQKPKAGLPISVFVATGEDGNSYTFTNDAADFDGGYYIGANHDIFLTAEIVNYTNDTKKVYAVVEMDYTKGKSKLDVSTDSLSVTQCETNGAIGIRPKGDVKKFSVKSKEMTVQMDAVIFGVRGHLHDGGVSVPLTINNKTVCESKAKYGGEGKETSKEEGNWATLSEMTECNELIPVKKGDILTISANYDLEAHPAREHAGGGMAEEMGLAGFRFSPTGPVPAAAVGNDATFSMSNMAQTIASTMTTFGSNLGKASAMMGSTMGNTAALMASAMGNTAALTASAMANTAALTAAAMGNTAALMGGSMANAAQAYGNALASKAGSLFKPAQVSAA